MGRTLGLNDDYWHALIPFLVQVILYPVMITGLGWDWRYVIAFTVLVLTVLQFVNEWKQAVDPDIEKKYGSWTNFIHNTRRDTRLFLLGLFGGMFGGLLICTL